jgi:hypothetical protein
VVDKEELETRQYFFGFCFVFKVDLLNWNADLGRLKDFGNQDGYRKDIQSLVFLSLFRVC